MVELVLPNIAVVPIDETVHPKEKDLENLTVASANISKDRKRIHLVLPGMKEKRVVYIRLPEKLKSSGGRSLWSGETWYTLNKIPSK